jgi:hypothetical protein
MSYDVVDVLVGYAAFHHLHLLIITIFFCQSDLSKATGMASYKVDVPSHYSISCELFCMPSICVQCRHSKNREKNSFSKSYFLASNNCLIGKAIIVEGRFATHAYV